MTSLVCGALAFDRILSFDGYFHEHILPEQIHILNLCFVVPEMRQEFGGCGGNITYSLRLLGESPQIMATVGHDSSPYLAHFDALGIDRQYIRILSDQYTAQATITTDKQNNQITAFHPGASAYAYLNKVSDTRNIGLCVIAPDNKRAMLEHARECAALDIPFIFDPGQMLPTFDAAELKELLRLSHYLTVNDYEAQLFMDISKLNLEEIAEQVHALVITQGEKGSIIIEKGKQQIIPAVQPKQVVDPTGCGDAFRAGLMFGITRQFDWLTIGRLSNLLGAIKVESVGPQNHHFSIEEIDERFYHNFGYRFS